MSQYCHRTRSLLSHRHRIKPEGKMFTLVIALTWFVCSCAAKQANPVLSYKFCRMSGAQNCIPSVFGSNSSFTFGDISSNTIFMDRLPRPALSVACTSSYPLHWQLFVFNDISGPHSIESNVTVSASGVMTYNYRFYFPNAPTGRILCQSFEHPNLAAEIYFTGGKEPVYVMLDKYLMEYAAVPSDRMSFLVPCSLKYFNAQFNSSSMKVTKAPVNEFVMDTASDRCIQCYPRTSEKENSSGCTFCGPFGLQQQFWEEAGAPHPHLLLDPASNHSYDEFRQCADDYDCSAKAIKAEHSSYDDCNFDYQHTCSDSYTAFQAYPRRCLRGSTASIHNFRTLERCMMEAAGTELSDSVEVSYDPRQGFRLEGPADYSAVYESPAIGASSAVYVKPFHTDTLVQPRLRYMSPNSSSSSTEGILCAVPKLYGDNLFLAMKPCASFFDCDVKIQVFEGIPDMAGISGVTWGLNVQIPFEYGRIIRKPSSHGVVTCRNHFKGKVGYATTKSYFFAGLNQISYFTSEHFPTDAVIVLSPDTVNPGRGRTATFTCIISSFLLFPTFRITREFHSGNTSNDGITLLELVTNQYTVEQTFSVNVTAKIRAITCAALLRNASKWLSASFNFGSHMTAENDHHTSLAIPRPYVMLYAALVILLLLAVFSCGMFGMKMFLQLRKLEVESTSAFADGKADQDPEFFEQTNAVNMFHRYSGGDFELEIENVIGEGRWGRCLIGKHGGVNVAVKELKEGMDPESLKELLKDVQLMASTGKHWNIVEFIGAIVAVKYQRSCLVLVEYSPHGDLLNCIRRHGSPGISAQISVRVGDYNVTLEKPCNAAGLKLEIHHLYYFCEQVAAGMAFLETSGITHGNLGARNVLVFEDFVVKVADFGLSKTVYKRSTNHGQLPLQWMAPETFMSLEFSSKSDMWSYGVTVWEVFTMGAVPFSEFTVFLKFKHLLESGLRLEQPTLASNSVYEFMSLTWSAVASDRPDFTSAFNFFKRSKETELTVYTRALESDDVVALGVEAM